MIIAFTGYKESGKDTAAQVLIDKYGFVKHCFADELRIATEAKGRYPEIRRLMRAFATDWVRERVDGDFWLNLFRKTVAKDLLECANIVITDLRFKNEARWVHDTGGHIVAVYRNGYECDGHKSETLEGVTADFVLENNETIANLRQLTEDLVERLFHDAL